MLGIETPTGPVTGQHFAYRQRTNCTERYGLHLEIMQLAQERPGDIIDEPTTSLLPGNSGGLDCMASSIVTRHRAGASDHVVAMMRIQRVLGDVAAMLDKGKRSCPES